MYKEAKYYKQLDNQKVKCELCPHECILSKNQTGICRTRKNIDGKLYSLVYGKAVATHIDPVEKKPLYHFLPGSKALSFGTIGCNMRCKFCQNWEISQRNFEENNQKINISPRQIVELAKENNCESIAYTYTEPIIFFEYMIDTARIAKKNNIKNIAVTNGFINLEPLSEMCENINGFNVDLKSFSEMYYKNICFAELEPVKKTLKFIKEKKKHLEITNLIIPNNNDDMKSFEEMILWIKDNIGKETPLHLSRFYPHYKMKDINQTPESTLFNAKKIAEKHLDFVYVGNLNQESNTYCPQCKRLLIRRNWGVEENNIIDGRCICGYEIKGVWK